VTTALHEIEEGTMMGVRGPLGNSWPIEYLEGKNIVVVGGGFAFTTLRAMIQYMLNDGNRKTLRQDHDDLRGEDTRTPHLQG